MAKISSYDPKPVPSLDDYLIGTDTPNSSKTKNYRVGDLVSLIGGATDYYFNREGMPYDDMTQVLSEVTADKRYPGQRVNIARVDYYYLGTSYVIKPVYDYWVIRSGSTTVVNNGYLYNWFAVTNESPICANNAHVPTQTEWLALRTYIGTIGGNKLKESGTSHWGEGNPGTDDFGFKLLPSGYLDSDGSITTVAPGTFVRLGVDAMFFASTSYDSTNAKGMVLQNIAPDFIESYPPKVAGMPVRLVVDTPIEIVDNNAIYVGNDGKRYKCVIINSVWWTAENLAETKYRDESLIPKVTGDSAWAILSTGAMCAYDNDEANALTTTTNDFQVPKDQVVEFVEGDNVTLELDKVGDIVKLKINAPVAGESSSGTYTPTLTNDTNVSSSSVSGANYSKVGNIVTVSVRGTVHYTSAVTTILKISLPIVSSLNGQYSGGVATIQGTGIVHCSGEVGVDSTTEATLLFHATSADYTGIFNVIFTYSL